MKFESLSIIPIYKFKHANVSSPKPTPPTSQALLFIIPSVTKETKQTSVIKRKQ